MTNIPRYECDTHVYRSRSGWQRWHAICHCGWRWAGTGGKGDAERAAREHLGERLEHTCYDPTTMEYGGPCSACVGEDTGNAAREIGEYLADQLPPDEAGSG